MVMSQRVLIRHRSLFSNNIRCWVFVSPLGPWFYKYGESRTKLKGLAVLKGFVGDCNGDLLSFRIISCALL